MALDWVGLAKEVSLATAVGIRVVVMVGYLADLRVALAPRCQCQPWTAPEAGLITNPPGFVLCSFGAFLRIFVDF